ncbi:MAG: ABC transporter ATP-binding protein [Chloroflexi bacterium]|nr:ABC transporter ATP-binding protein [Chloroflexota bacterium]
MTTISLEARNLVKRFGRVAAVDDVSFQIEQGEVLTLLGPSGCGKTTTLRMVAGFEKPDAGEIDIEGRTVFSTPRRIGIPPEKRALGMVFQSYAIWPHMTVFENVAYPLTVRRLPAREIKEKVDQTLELVGLRGFAERSSMALSGGQQQRVALARALVYSPGILLLDEPLSNLDAKLRGQMRIELKRLQERVNVTVLFVTHDQIEAMSMSTRLAVMNHGKIEQLGTPQEVYEHPATPYVEDFLGHVLRFRGQVLERGLDAALVEIEGAPGTQLRAETADDALTRGNPVLAAIRPEELELHRAGEGPRQNTIRATVEKVLYLGSDCELLLRFGEIAYTLVVSRALLSRVATEVDLHLPPEHVRVWADLRPPTLASQPTAASTIAVATTPVGAAVAGSGS